MKYIKPSNYEEPIIVDDEDYARISRFNWHVVRGSVQRIKNLNLKVTAIAIANEVMQDNDHMFDHKDGDFLNNQKTNLRITDTVRNSYNKKKRSGTFTSKYKGVSRYKGRFRACITCNKRLIHLGYFDSEEDAARAYNTAALKFHGEFAYLNLVC